MDHSHVYDEKVPNPYYYFIAACLPQQMIYCCGFAAESQNDQYNQVVLNWVLIYSVLLKYLWNKVVVSTVYP